MNKNHLIDQLRNLAKSDQESFFNVLQNILDADLWRELVQIQNGHFPQREMTREEQLEAKKEKIKKLAEESFNEFDEVYKKLA